MKYFLILFLFFFPNAKVLQAENLTVNESKDIKTPDYQPEKELFQKIIHKYKISSGVTMNFEKKTYLKFLKKNRYSKGKIFLSQGLMKLQIQDTLNTQIIFDKTHLWYQTVTPERKTKTTKINLKTEAKNKAIISFLFNPDLFFQVFYFVSARSKGRTTIFEFLPIQKTDNISRLSVKIESDRVLLVQVEWRDLNTLEEYTFSDIRMNQKIPAKTFKLHKSG